MGATVVAGELDIDAEGYVAVGGLTAEGFEALWPGFAPHSLEVYCNPTLLRRHLQGAGKNLDRVAAFNLYGYLIPAVLFDPIEYRRYDKVSPGRRA